VQLQADLPVQTVVRSWNDSKEKQLMRRLTFENPNMQKVLKGWGWKVE
jgi:hypothetical protein